MATSTSPTVCLEALDPQEELDFAISLTPLLEVGEAAQTGFTLALTPEAVLLGLKIMGVADSRPAPVLDPVSNDIQLWLTIEAAKKNDPAFDGPGALLPFEILFNTDFNRKRNRTFAVLVRQR